MEPLAQVAHQANGPSLGATRPCALLFDDDCSARRQLACDLRARGFDVHVADDAEESAATALCCRPDLLVLELRTRAGLGLNLLARLRPQLPSAKLVVLTSYGSVASAVRAIRLGATNYLCKPAAAAEVLRAAGAAEADDLTPDGEMDLPSVPFTLDQAIWEYIHRTIEDAGSLSEAARRLGLWRQSLKRMVSKYRPTGTCGIPTNESRRYGRATSL